MKNNRKSNKVGGITFGRNLKHTVFVIIICCLFKLAGCNSLYWHVHRCSQADKDNQ